MKQNKRTKMIIILVMMLLLVGLIGILGGTVWIHPSEIPQIFRTSELTKNGRILMYIRIPRVAGAIVAGMGLAVSGSIIQAILNNPLAGPNIIGINAGAGVMVAVVALLFPSAYYMLPFAAFIGAMLTMLLIYFLGLKTGSSKLTIVLAGVAINSLLNGAIDLIYTVNDQVVLASLLFKIGGLNGINMQVLKMAACIIVIGIAMILLFHNELELFSLGEQTARMLGLPVGFYRFFFLMMAALLAGAAVSFAGLLGFVGLIVPHIARLMVGDEMKYQIIVSALMGAELVVFCDFIARTCFAPNEIPVGIILSFIGAPFFVWLLLRRKKGVRND